MAELRDRDEVTMSRRAAPAPGGRAKTLYAIGAVVALALIAFAVAFATQ